MLQEFVTVVFLGLVVVLFAIRRRGVKGERASLVPGLVALIAGAGSFAVIAFLLLYVFN